MKIKSIALCICICVMLIVCAGCPAPIDTESVENGDFFRSEITTGMSFWYGVEFSDTNLPTVSITYQNRDGEMQTAEFLLDGYDADMKIGYKLAANKDKVQWEKERKSDVRNVPDLNDAELIRDKALDYEFPVIFMCAYEYQDYYSRGQTLENLEIFEGKLDEIINTEQIKHWGEEQLYDGVLVKKYFEEAIRNGMWQIDFKHDELPMAEIEYNNKKAVFRLDGYDTDKRVGYKFVTDADKQEWEKQRQEGNSEAPDLNYYETIKKAALSYDFPVIFIYNPEYWKSTLNIITSLDNETESALKEWLKK